MVHMAWWGATHPADVVLQERHRAPGEVFRQEQWSLRQYRADQRHADQQALHGVLQGEADQRGRLLRGAVQSRPQGG